MPPRRRFNGGGKRKKSFRKKKSGMRSTGSRRGRGKRVENKVQKIIRSMKAVTEPLSFVYTWGKRQTNSSSALGFGLQFPILQWHDGYDISNLHNALFGVLNSGITGVLNKFAVGGYKAEFTLKNLTNAEVTMDIYEWQLREDITVDDAAKTQWGSSTSTQVYYANVEQNLYSGLQEQGQGGVGPPTWPIGYTAFDVSRFCSFVKIKKCKKGVTIMGGSFKKFVISRKHWHLYNGTKCIGTTSGVETAINGYGKKTGGIFAIATGAAIADSATHGNISTAYVDIGIIAKERYMYTGVNNTIKRSNIVRDFGAITTASTMNYATEAVSTITSA